MGIRLFVVLGAAGAIAVAGCAALAPKPDYDALALQMVQGSFRTQGIASVDRLQQDASNAECSKSLGKALPEDRAQAIMEANLKTVKLPSDGKFIGDWQAGERLAQSGRGMTWTDANAAPAANGGACYNCHQIGPAEISYGTIGPSLLAYGKNRGVTDPQGELSRPIVQYTWTKLWNAKAYNACSGMPRFGHTGMLDETQLKDLMALLLDPRSPVNR